MIRVRSQMRLKTAHARPRPALTLIELLVVIAIVSILIAMLVPAVQRVRESAQRANCASNLRQMGLALHGYHDANRFFPPGAVTEFDIQDSFHAGFTYLLPHLEQENLRKLYNFEAPWFDKTNYAAVKYEIPIFYCPSNRRGGTMDLTLAIQQWSCEMPPVVGAIDYLLCKGANAALNGDPTKAPTQARGMFNVTFADRDDDGTFQQTHMPRFRVRIKNMTDGLSSTLAIGEGAGGNPLYLVADLGNPGQPVTEPFRGAPTMIDQAWSASSFSDAQHPWYGGIFGVTAQYGLAPDPRDEPMNRRPSTPTIVGADSSGTNANGKSWVGGFRSVHPGGCNFLYADGSVHWLVETIDPAVYRGLSTYAGGECISGAEIP